MRNSGNLKQHEIIGCAVKVIQSKDAGTQGMSGIVVDETKNTLTVKTGKGLKKVLKENAVFEFAIPETKEKVTIEGDEISLQPEKRLKKVKKEKRRW